MSGPSKGLGSSERVEIILERQRGIGDTVIIDHIVLVGLDMR